MIELPGWMWMACMFGGAMYFGGVAFAVALMRQWRCFNLLTWVVALTWVVSLPIVGWLVILPLLRDEW